MSLAQSIAEVESHEEVIFNKAKKLIRQKHAMTLGFQQLIERLNAPEKLLKKDLLVIIADTLEKSEL